MSRWTEQEMELMNRALALAGRGLGRVEPNPMVGCVIVRGGRIVAEGYHRRFGADHAEVEALRRCGGLGRGATVYVTLEPCCHRGKTGPCSEALIAARVGRVVAAMRDPFAAVAGKGLARLRRAGIEVDVGLCGDRARRLNAAYVKLRSTGRPWVILKWAQSLDGKIATRTGESKWITSPRARREAHRLRGRVDAIIVGSGTAMADDPMLTCRAARAKRVASRVVVDSRLRLSPTLKLVRTGGRVPTIVATTAGAVRSRPRAADELRRRGCEVLVVKQVAGHVSLPVLLEVLGRREMTNVMVEGGGKLLGAFFDQGLADEAVVFVSPRLIGGAEAPSALEGRGIERVTQAAGGAWQAELRRLGREVIHRVVLTDSHL